MLKIFMACSLAVATLATSYIPASATTVVISDHHRGPGWRHPPRRHWHRPPPRRCYTKVVREWRHGHRVTKRVRVCR